MRFRPMTPAPTAHLAALLLSVLLMSGCATWFGGGFEAPEVRLLRVETIEARLDEQLLRLHSEISNPTARSLPVPGMHYRLCRHGLPLARHEDDRSLIVPAHSERRVEANLHTNHWRHIRQITRLLERPDEPVRYHLEGRLKAGLLFGREVPFSRSGEIVPRDHIPE